MRSVKLISACLMVMATAGANAGVIGSLGGGTGPFLSLSTPQSCSMATPCSLGTASIVGGSTYASDLPFADMPAGSVFQSRFLAAGTTAGNNARVSFAGSGTSYVSFLWGSPDTYNALTVTSTLGTYVFNVMNLGFSVTNGNQSFSQYVQFQADAGESITSLLFSSAGDSFEATNFSVTRVPEPSMLALLLTGAGVIGFMGRRRRALRA